MSVRLYIAGAISENPSRNIPRFAEAANELEVAGYDTVNPARRGVIDGYEWADYMRDCIPELLGCDGVALLPGWENSKGARLEFTIAHDLDMPAESVDWWIREKRQ